MGDLRSRLLSVKGMGNGRLQGLISRFGGIEELERILLSEEVSTLSSIDGFSERMAVDLILASRGGNEEEIKGNEPVWELVSQVQRRLSSCMHTSRSRNRVLLLRPGGDLRENLKRSKQNHSKKELLHGRDRKRIEELLSVLDRRSSSSRKKGSSQYILVPEDDEAYDGIRDKGLDRSCLVISPDELTSIREGTIILVHNRREIDEDELPIAASVHFTRPAHEIVPDVVVERLLGQRNRFQAVSELREAFSHPSGSKRFVELMDDLTGLQSSLRDPESVREEIESIRNELNSSLEESISALTLSGKEALSILSSEEPETLKEIYADHARKAAGLVREKLGIRADIFKMRYPLETDTEVLDRIITRMEEKVQEEVHREKVQIAGEIIDLEAEVMKEIEWAYDLDMDFGIGCFVADHSLNPFELSERVFFLEGAADLELRGGGQFQAVDYHLGPEGSRVALLTGANSGGKTTLLMTVAQTVVLANMGLPVPAEKAGIPDIGRLFIYRPRRRMDAGGLEGFLKELLPLSLDVDGSSMVLADELEAMTELEAASRIIGVFVAELNKRGAYSIVVTHMADEVLRFVDCRVDGIEARGLDEKHNLIVDRTPQIGHHARSTPELIIRRLEARARGKEKEIFKRVLENF